MIGTTTTGNFSVSPIHTVRGELKIDRRNSQLVLRDEQPFHSLTNDDRFLQGELFNGKKASLHKCIYSRSGSTGGTESGYYFEKIFPNIAVTGDKNLSPTEKSVKSIKFTTDDAHSLFYEFDTLGYLSSNKEQLEKLIKDSNKTRDVTVGEHPEAFYYSDKKEVSNITTAGFSVEVLNLLSSSWGSPKEVSFKTEMATFINFEDRQTLDHALDKLRDILMFYDLILGRPQTLQRLQWMFLRKAMNAHVF